MTEKRVESEKRESPQVPGITRITVAGFKSISEEQSIEIRPLTILAGVNSSGKSSIMQPLLLLKQTLEATYDPGPLLLNGPNVKFTSVDQLLSYMGRGGHGGTFHVGTGVGSSTLMLRFEQTSKGLEIQEMIWMSAEGGIPLRPEMTRDEIISAIPASLRSLPPMLSAQGEWAVMRNRCFLEVRLRAKDGQESHLPFRFSPGMVVEPYIRQVIHLPGLRGNPERTYPVTAVGLAFPGTFEKYAASVIAQWQADEQQDCLRGLNGDLKRLNLTWKVESKRIDDTQVELQVGRLVRAARGGSRDLVNIADVGFGVSQSLPVLVALHAAQPGQLVYLEQPEIHLHPRAQFVLAQVLADAAARGVRVVAETHSSLLLLGVQALVAEGKLAPELVKLHWFERGDDGVTRVTSADLDETGAFGDWPEDFAQVDLEAQSRYLDATELRQVKV